MDRVRLPLILAVALAQPPWAAPRQTPTFRAGVQTVVVYATVSDSGGRLLTDLPQDAFEVFDNGRRVQVTVFSNQPQRITVALMLDMSGSMQTKVLRVRDAARSFVAALQPGDRAAIGTFGDEVAVSPLLTGNSRVLLRILNEELWPGGFTPLWRALDLAMTSVANEAGRRVVLVLTDGADTDTTSWARSQSDIERRAVRESFMVCAIGMEGTGLARGIESVTEQTGGGHFELQNAADLAPTFVRVVEELRHQYLLGFVPAAEDGKLHRLEVRGMRPGMRVRARTAYQAGAER